MLLFSVYPKINFDMVMTTFEYKLETKKQTNPK